MLKCYFIVFLRTKRSSFSFLKIQQAIGGNPPILVLKRMLGVFLKILPLKKILEFQDRKRDCETSRKKKILNRKLNQ